MKSGVNSWNTKSLAEVFDVRDGTHDSPKYIDKGFPLITSKNLKADGSIDFTKVNYISEKDYHEINKRSKVDVGDLLFAMIGTIGSPTIVKDEPNYAIKNVALFKPKTDEVLVDYLKYYLLSPFIINQMISESRGATQKFVSLKYLRTFKIPFPPITEQKLVVSKLDQLFERIDKAIILLEQNISNALHLMASVLNDVFEGNSDWKEYLLSEKFTLVNGRAYKQHELLNEGKYKVIRIQNLNGGENWYYSDLELGPEKYCNEDDLLYSWSGTPHSSFGAFVWSGQKSIFHYHIWKVEIHDNIDRNFALFLFKYLTEVAISQSHGGTGMMHITKGKMESLKIRIPEQDQQIYTAKKLSNLEKRTNQLNLEYKKKLQNLKALKASILDAAFKGELSNTSWEALSEQSALVD